MSGSDENKYLGFSKATFYRKRKKQQENRERTYNAGDKRSEKVLPTTTSLQPCSSMHNNSNQSPFLFLPVQSNNAAAVFESGSQPIFDNGEEDTDAHSLQQQACLLSPTQSEPQEKLNRLPDLKSKPAIMELCKLFKKHSLTDQCCDDILKLLHNPEVVANRSSIPKSNRGFEFASGVSLTKISVGWKCKQCNRYCVKEIMQGEREASSQLKCCDKTISYNDDHFIVLSARQILEIMLPILHEYLVKSRGVDKPDVDLILNTDGAPLFKGSKSSFWPVLAAIDHINYSIRKENVLLLGVWVGTGGNCTKPDFDNFLKGIVQELNELKEDGVKWIANDNSVVTTKVNTKLMMCDSIARPLVQNMCQFNAQFGCGYCYHEQNGPYYRHINLVDVRWRSDVDIAIDCMNLINSNERHSRGVKGTSPMQLLKGLDVVFGFPPDILHTVYLGVTKHLTEAWICSNNHQKNFYIKPSVQKSLDKRLQCIKPPTRVSRPPRPLEMIKFYKGHEFMMWLLYYSPVVLAGLLNNDHYQHWMLLIRGIALLTSENVNDYSIQLAEKCLEQFSSDICTLYGDNYQRFNIHLLLHMGRFVRMYGPLQNFSMTIFENFNMQIQKYVTSSFGEARQVCKRYFRDLLVNHSSPKPEHVILTTCTHKFHFVPNLNEEVMLRSNDQGNEGFYYFTRIKTHKKCFHSELYSQIYRHDNSYFLVDDHVFHPKYFLQQRLSKKIFGIGNCYRVRLHTEFNLPHFYESMSPNDYRIFEMPDDPEIVMQLEHNGKSVFIKFLNEIEANSE